MGTRAGEQRALTWDDLDLAAGTALIDKTYFRTTLQRSTKTGRDRTVPVPPHVVAVLREWRDRCPPSPQGLVFPSPSGAPLDLDDFRARVFRPAVQRAGLPPDLRIHDLRHTAASLYLSSGATVRDVMAICGWSQLATAQRYLHSTESLSHAAERLSAARAEALRARTRHVTRRARRPTAPAGPSTPSPSRPPQAGSRWPHSSSSRGRTTAAAKTASCR